MLVDLGRNDFGKVSEYGSVRVVHHMRIHRYSRVMHITSEVEGRIKEERMRLTPLRRCLRERCRERRRSAPVKL